MQAVRHGDFFRPPGPASGTADRFGPDPEKESSMAHEHGDLVLRPVAWHAVLLVATLLPIVLLSKSLAISWISASRSCRRRRRWGGSS